MSKRAHVFIHGDVIGVGFRSWTVRQAQELKLAGWVRNLSRNTVEAVFEGKKENINQMIKRCHHGPEVSWVEKVEVEWEEAKDEYTDFNIKY